MIVWTIGAGGLLGRAVTRQATRHGVRTFAAVPIPWDDADGAVRAITANAKSFHDAAADDDWAVVWAAGNAATASHPDEAARELAFLEAAAEAIRDVRPSGRGAFVLASSAGGVYAGCSHPPFDDRTAPHPLSPYGELKLTQEQAASRLLDAVCPVVIARISNLYGPGQNLDKLQGLVSRLALSAVTKQPVTMFVSLDTIRDYIDADDAAVVLLHWAHKAVREQPEHPWIRVVASGQPVSLGALIHLAQDVTRTRIPVAVGEHASAAAQARDLRLTPSDDGHVHALVRTTLPEGIKRVHLDILERHQKAANARR